MRKRTPDGMSIRDRIEFNSMPVTETGCWIWLPNCRRYGELKINGKMVKAHRASWEAYNNQSIPDGLNVLHQCDVTECVNPAHLFLGTQLDNIRDMIAKGRDHKRGLSGAKNPMAVLSAEQVRAIRLSTKSESVLAAEYETSRSNINAIRRRITWKEVA